MKNRILSVLFLAQFCSFCFCGRAAADDDKIPLMLASYFMATISGTMFYVSAHTARRSS
jgi:hypothetical protein